MESSLLSSRGQWVLKAKECEIAPSHPTTTTTTTVVTIDQRRQSNLTCSSAASTAALPWWLSSNAPPIVWGGGGVATRSTPSDLPPRNEQAQGNNTTGWPLTLQQSIEMDVGL